MSRPVACLQWCRRLLAVVLAFNIWLMASGHENILTPVVIALVVSGICLQTAVIRRMDRERLAGMRPRPDYGAIARMERDIYGETFKHDGAPQRRDDWADLADFAAAVRAASVRKAMSHAAGTESATWHWNCVCGESAHGTAATSGDAQAASSDGLSAHHRSAGCKKRDDRYRSNLPWERPS